MEHFIKVTAGEKTNEIWNTKAELKAVDQRTDNGETEAGCKKALVPGYGKKGMGMLHPKKALYNKVYKKTTFSIFDLFKWK